MIKQFHDVEGQVMMIRPDLQVMHTLLETLQAELQEPFLEQMGFETKEQLLEAAIWINNTLSKLLAEASNQLIETRNIIHNTQYVPETTYTVCYWPDGYWIQDKSTAELLDKVNAFEGKHSVIDVAANADIGAEVRKRLS